MNSRLPQFPRRRNLLALISVVGVAALLSSCQSGPLFGPKPDPNVTELAQVAEVDAEQLRGVDDNLAHLRSGQAAELYNEVLRLCGVYEDGTVPERCATMRQDIPGGDNEGIDDESSQRRDSDPHQLGRIVLEHSANKLEDVERASAVLIARQGVDVAKAVGEVDLRSAFDALGTSLQDEDAQAARDLLRWEYSVIFGLETAQAWLPNGSLDDELQAHRLRATFLRVALEPTGDVPVAEPGYSFDGIAEPTDDNSAREFIRAAEAGTVNRWLEASVDGDSDSWRLAALSGAADAALSGGV